MFNLHIIEHAFAERVISFGERIYRALRRFVTKKKKEGNTRIIELMQIDRSRGVSPPRTIRRISDSQRNPRTSVRNEESGAIVHTRDYTKYERTRTQELQRRVRGKPKVSFNIALTRARSNIVPPPPLHPSPVISYIRRVLTRSLLLWRLLQAVLPPGGKKERGRRRGFIVEVYLVLLYDRATPARRSIFFSSISTFVGLTVAFVDTHTGAFALRDLSHSTAHHRPFRRNGLSRLTPLSARRLLSK